LFNATLHVKPERPIAPGKAPANYRKTKDDFYVIDQFSAQLGIASGTIDSDLIGPLTHIRIHIPIARETWVIISEINFSSADESKTTSTKKT
jgi:hypothetical protein